jgi:hypothetical protein
LIRRGRSSVLTTRLFFFANRSRSSAKSLRISRVGYRSTATIPVTHSYSLSNRLRCWRSGSVRRKPSKKKLKLATSREIRN